MSDSLFCPFVFSFGRNAELDVTRPGDEERDANATLKRGALGSAERIVARAVDGGAAHILKSLTLY